jgi:hypothetical protein
MTIYFLQRLQPPVLPFLHEILNTEKKKAIPIASSRRSKSESECIPVRLVTAGSHSDLDQDEIKHYNVFESNLNRYVCL